MAHDVIATCPVCSNELAITRLRCGSCGTTLEGDFSVGRFGRLNRDQLALLESFLRSRGNLREMERELGISYPTVRARVEALVRALGVGAEVFVRHLPAADYQTFLNHGYLQLSSNVLHDHFCANGLDVATQAGDTPFKIYGDTVHSLVERMAVEAKGGKPINNLESQLKRVARALLIVERREELERFHRQREL